MLLRRRNRLVHSGVPAPLNGAFVAGEGTLEDSLLNDGSVIPSQVPPEPPEESSRGGQYAGKQRWATDVRAIADRLPNFDPNRTIVERNIVHPGTIPLTNFSGFTLGTVSGQLALSLVFTRRNDRKRFILANVFGLETIYFSYKNSPNALLPLYVGQVWDESGSEVSNDDIWICGKNPNGGPTPYVAYEGRLHGHYD